MNLNRFYILLFTVISVIFSACDDNKEEVIIKADVTDFSPTSGGGNTVLTLNGHHFGTETNNVRVTINGKDAIIQEVTDNSITAVVQKGMSSGLVRVILGERPNAQVLIYNTEFTYISNQVVSTYLGGKAEGENDGEFENATLSKPRYIAWGKDNSLYFIEDGASDPENMACIRKATNGQVSTLLKATDSPLVERIRALDFSLDGNTMYIANDNNANGSMGFGTMGKEGETFTNLTSLWDQSGITSTKVHPQTGAVFIGYHTGSWVYQYDENSFVPKIQLPDDTGKPAEKGNINGIAFDKSETIVYIVSRKNHVIYKANYDWDTNEFTDMTLLAGGFGLTGYSDGYGTDARFNEPSQADVGPDGNLYVADRGNHCIRMITPDGDVSTYAGQNKAGMEDGIASTALFNNPEGCQFGPDGALYIADYSNHAIRKIEEGTTN